MVNAILKCIKPVFYLRHNILPQTFMHHDTLSTIRKITEIRFFSSFVGQSARDRQSTKLNEQESDEGFQDETRLLKVAIIGVPNAGKSTIINQLAGRRVCSISSKVHTTRCKARAIAVYGNTQLVFLDTPGLVNSSESERHHLEHSFHSDSEMAMIEADVIGVVHDVSNTWTRHKLDPKVLRLLHLYPRKHSFLILNKIDLLKSKRKLLDLITVLTNKSLKENDLPLPETEIQLYRSNKDEEEEDRKVSNEVETEGGGRLSEWQVEKKVKQERGWSHFREVFMISALTGNGTSDVRDYLLHISEPSPWLYPPDQFTDQPSETVVMEAVRSKLLEHLPKEIPYNIKTRMEYFETNSEGSIVSVVLVECPSFRLQKLLIGSRGMRIKEIARHAEQELQSTFRQSVRLKVVVSSKEVQQPESVRKRRLA